MTELEYFQYKFFFLEIYGNMSLEHYKDCTPLTLAEIRVVYRPNGLFFLFW